MKHTTPTLVRTNLVETGTLYGITWATAQHPNFNTYNGYVLLPSGHPWRDLDLSDDDYDVVTVHGGITYGPDKNGWIGFDTNHFLNEVRSAEWVRGETLNLAAQAHAAGEGQS